jgi:hypothetical protein
MSEHDVVLVLFSGVVTFCVTLCAQRVLARDKRSQFRIYRLAFRGFPEYHRRLLFDGLTDELWEAKIPSHLRDHCITFVFFLEAVGRAVAKDVRVAVHAKKGTGIVAHQFLSLPKRRSVVALRRKQLTIRNWSRHGSLLIPEMISSYIFSSPELMIQMMWKSGSMARASKSLSGSYSTRLSRRLRA